MGAGGSKLSKDDFVYFGSGTKLKIMSNFADVGSLVFEGRTYATSEHAYQAQRVEEEDMDRMAVGGDLGGLEGLKVLLGEEEGQQKMNHWGHGAVKLSGIVAKMVVKDANNAKLQVPLKLKKDDLEGKDEIFMRILRAKWDASKEFRDALRATRGKLLVEFDRAAARKNGSSAWGGVVKNGVLLGENRMGKIMMELRRELV